MIVMNPYSFLESHREQFDRMFVDAVKASGLATQKSPIPGMELTFQVQFEPKFPQDLENELKWFLENKLASIKEMHNASVVYDELIVYPSTKELHYEFTFMIRYA